MVQQSEFCGYAQYTLQNESLSVTIMTLGATVRSIRFAGREIALRYATAQEYLAGSSYIGAIVGRYANRIRAGRITLNGTPLQLACNENGNQLHGGPDSFDRRVWAAEPVGESAVRFTLFSPDGDNGYPGNLQVAVTYRLEKDCLRLEFAGVSDADTIFAPTSHLYFNLSGADTILEDTMQIDADRYVEVDAALLPTGRCLPCEGRFDFHAPRAIGGAYDHCFLLNGSRACVASGGGITMEVESDYPALQFYSGEFLNGSLRPFAGFAVEPGHCPDSPNVPEFASPLLRKGEPFQRYICYRFTKR